MSADTPPAPEAHIIVGFDGSPPAVRALAAAVRLLKLRKPGRITLVWVAHLASTVELSADAIAIVEDDFGEVARELRTQAAKQMAGSGVSWDFQRRQGLIAQQLIAEAEAVRAARPDDVVAIWVGSSSSGMHRLVGSVAVNLARHSPVPITVVP
jgi:nucleotide-binding universal stress UspA family protein